MTTAAATQSDDVTAALCRVMADLGGIEKLSPAQRRDRGLPSAEVGISYAYRGIDQIAAAVQPLLARHGVVIVPRVVDSRVTEVLINNRPWTDTITRVEWTIAGPNGTVMHACTEGWGRDNSDKGTNKAMTGAFKNLLLRLLCIGDPADDTDGTTHERDEYVPPPDPIAVLFERVKAATGTPLADDLKAIAAQHQVKLTASALASSPAFAAEIEQALDAEAERAK